MRGAILRAGVDGLDPSEQMDGQSGRLAVFLEPENRFVLQGKEWEDGIGLENTVQFTLIHVMASKPKACDFLQHTSLRRYLYLPIAGGGPFQRNEILGTASGQVPVMYVDSEQRADGRTEISFRAHRGRSLPMAGAADTRGHAPEAPWPIGSYLLKPESV